MFLEKRKKFFKIHLKGELAQVSGCKMNKESQDTSYGYTKNNSGDVSFTASSISFGAGKFL